MPNDTLFDEIEQFLADGGEAAQQRPSTLNWRDYRVEQGPPDDGREWIRFETMEGKVWWQSYDGKTWPPEISQ